MNKKFLIILTLFLLTPLLSSAQSTLTLSTSATLTPTDSPFNYIYNACPAVNPGSLDLSWQIPSINLADQNKYICKIECAVCDSFNKKGDCEVNSPSPLAGDCSIPLEAETYCKQANHPCGIDWRNGIRGLGNTFVRKNDNGVVRYDYPDNSWNLYPSAKVREALVKFDHSVANLKLKEDKVAVPNVIPGQSYRVSCLGPTKKDPYNYIGVGATSSWITVNQNCGSGEPCEVSFSDIQKSLFDYKNTTITEKDFRSWAVEQEEDFANYPEERGLGSGDFDDLKQFIDGNQCYVSSQADPESYNYLTTLSYLKQNSDNHDAAPFVIYIADPAGLPPVLTSNSIVDKWLGGHAMIELSFKPKDSNETNPTKFVLEALDPNEAKIRKLNVSKMQLQVAPGVFVNTLFIEDYCAAPDPSSGDTCTKAIILNTRVSAPGMVNMVKLKTNAVRKNTADWLRNENNRPKIDNFNGDYPESDGGVCAGWTDFVLAVAYHGTFSGEDYHPNDSKLVGKDCDANHYPIVKKSAWLDSKNWLGNILSPLSNLFNLSTK